MKDVTVVGSGPTGLMLAGELALAGVDVALLERRSTPDLVGTRARGFHSRTIEILDQRGIADRFLTAGQTAQVLSFAGTRLDIGGFPSPHPYTVGLGQSHIEQILLGWVTELGVPIRRGVEVTGFEQDDAGVDVHLTEGKPRRTAYLVGADGGRSVVRKAAGIDFVGAEATRSHLIAEVGVTEEVHTGIRLDDVGIHAMNVTEDGRTAGIVVTEQQIRTPTEPTMADLRDALTAVYGTDFGVHDPTWISRFTDATRQAVAYRSGRVLLAGDSAHIHPPTGGQGIGLGVQDAVNLGWKLAQVVRDISPDALLDSYHAERHPATARILKNVMVQALLQRGDARTEAMRDTLADLLSFDGPRAHLAGLLSGLDVRYDLGEGHPLLGRRMPDLDLNTTHGPRRVFELLHDARPVLLNLGGPGALDITPWADRVLRVDADYTGRWELPVIGTVTAPVGVLVRPDGHVAWVGDGTQTGLSETLTTWFGQPSVSKPRPLLCTTSPLDRTLKMRETLRLDEFLAGAHVDAAAFALRPDYRAMLLAVDGLVPGPSDEASERLLQEAEASARESLGDGSVERLPHVAAWREAYRAFGAKPGRTRNSLEALLRRTASGLPRVNRLTDLYNAVSVLHVVPVGGEDLTRYTGSPRLVGATGTEPFDTTVDGAVVIEYPEPGEVVWCDDVGVTCRRWNWRQARRTQLREDTTSALFILDALDPMTDEALRAAADALAVHLARLGPNVRTARRLIALGTKPGDGD